MYWFVQHFFPGQYLLFVAIAGAFGFVFREILWEMIGRAWLLARRLLRLAPEDGTLPAAGEAPAPPRNSVVGGLRAIREHDPGFDAGAFLQQVQQVCATVKQGWAARNLETCRSVMTETCWQSQKNEMDRGIVEGWRSLAASITFVDGQIELATTQREADRITVRVRISCPPGTGKLVRGRRIAEWQEDWTFVRPITLALPPGARVPASIRRDVWEVERMDHVAVHMEQVQPAA